MWLVCVVLAQRQVPATYTPSKIQDHKLWYREQMFDWFYVFERVYSVWKTLAYQEDGIVFRDIT